ncbi:MAG: hypothetical protein U0792_03660 [Gemmataceae bacterium]
MGDPLRIAVLLVVSLVPGCGSEPEQTGPKQTITDQEKKQVQDLNKQRQDEWGSTNTANPKKK